MSALWWWMLGPATVVYALVVIAMVAAVARARRQSHDATGEGRPPRVLADRAAGRWVGGAALATMCVSAVFLVYYVRIGSALDRHVTRPMVIEVVGHQWWWEVTYADPDAPTRVTTANEIHVPIGQEIAIELRSDDVIHSFWVPSVAGKRDLIPGHPTRAWIQADTAGEYRGQCSQFCGLQHAHMAFFVIAESRERFDAWLEAQRRAAQIPTDSVGTAGRNEFVAARCGSCHTIAGTIAVGSFGPNLTHLGSRSTIASGTLTNSRDHLAAWILNPASFKPGALMPSNPLSGPDLQALTAYLESLR